MPAPEVLVSVFLVLVSVVFCLVVALHDQAHRRAKAELEVRDLLGELEKLARRPSETISDINVSWWPPTIHVVLRVELVHHDGSRRMVVYDSHGRR